MPGTEPYPYIYVNVDGSARELHADERQYLEADYKFGDGNAPYVKSSYEQRNGWGEISGTMRRDLLPRGATIEPAPAENPNKPMDKAETIAWLRAKGCEVIENSDGSFAVKHKPR